MDRIPLKPTDLELGQPLRWDLYNQSGRRIFRKGLTFNTADSILRASKMKLFYQSDESERGNADAELRTSRQRQYHFDNEQQAKEALLQGRLFQFLDYCILQTRLIADRICAGSSSEAENIANLVENLELLYQRAEDACIGAVHLEFEEHPYSCMHPVYAAILCMMMSKSLGYPKQQRFSLIAAALTANLGMYTYHDELVNKTDKLTDTEFDLLKKHPELSCQLLQANGINDPLWQKIVLQSHERLDGSGYPNRLQGDEICHEARIYCTVDSYLAMIMPRAYRAAKAPKIAMTEIYKSAVAEKDAISIGLIKRLGIYPPGSCVMLPMDRIAIVVERNMLSSIYPKVAVVATADGKRIRPIQFIQTDGKTKIIEAISHNKVQGVDPSTIWQGLQAITNMQYKTS